MCGAGVGGPGTGGTLACGSEREAPLGAEELHFSASCRVRWCRFSVGSSLADPRAIRYGTRERKVCQAGGVVGPRPRHCGFTSIVEGKREGSVLQSGTPNKLFIEDYLAVRPGCWWTSSLPAF